jgi:hypothetical protein
MKRERRGVLLVTPLCSSGGLANQCDGVGHTASSHLFTNNFKLPILSVYSLADFNKNLKFVTAQVLVFGTTYDVS